MNRRIHSITFLLMVCLPAASLRKRRGCRAMWRVSRCWWQISASQAALAQSAIRLEQKSQHLAVFGQVLDNFYRIGEWAALGQPVVSILPAENIKVRFFCPENQIG